MIHPSESHLVQRVMQGDQAALGDLLESYQHRLYNVVYRMVNHREDALELTQDALVKVIEHVHEYNGRCRISTWMIRIAMNLAISHLRKRRLRRAASLEATAPGSNNEDQLSGLRQQLADDGEPGPDQHVQQREMIENLMDALDGLDEDFRAVLVLRDLDQMDYQEIANVLSLPLGTVKSRLFRARLALRREMLRIYPPAAASDAEAESVGEPVAD